MRALTYIVYAIMSVISLSSFFALRLINIKAAERIKKTSKY